MIKDHQAACHRLASVYIRGEIAVHPASQLVSLQDHATTSPDGVSLSHRPTLGRLLRGELRQDTVRTC